ncbi:MAG: hypothetical protein ILP23_00070 [Paludibacteraceae bacterium]|nr:hypothetical protein [Paludibacteraceae bacterium]
MNEMYWITRFDGVLTVVIIFLIAFLILALFFLVGYFSTYDEEERKVLRKRAIICGSIEIFLLIAQAFVPTTKQALIIYGVGGTIDYIKSNDTAKQLPDKAIIALDKYLESINEEKGEQHGNK